MDYKNINDYEILYLIEENMEDAQVLLYNKYRPLILSIANKYFKIIEGCSLEMEDLTQDGYIGLDRAIKKYSTNRNCLFYTFAILCIERQMQTAIRNQQNNKNNILNNAVSLENTLPLSDMVIGDTLEDNSIIDPLNFILQKEKEIKLIHFQHDLSIVQAQVFQLRYQGFTYNEIAQLLDLSKKSVDSHLVRIRQKLRNSGLRYSI